VLTGLLRSLRPSQWSKNVFVLAPLVFGQLLGNPEAVARVALAFVAFCAASSAVYLINDIRDREEDRQHPLKRNRPIAAGILPVPVAYLSAAVLALLAVGAGLRLGSDFAAMVVIYLALIAAYSLGLKQFVILDVMILSVGFVLRVLAGGAAAQVEVSNWLLLCTIFVSLFLAFSKRRHELVLLGEDASDQRSVLSHYSPQFLDQMINVVTASTVVAYALYAVAPETQEKFHTSRLVYTVPLVLFGIFRYLYLIYQKPRQRNPTEAILKDIPSLVNLALWALAVLWIVYLATG
jgi:4-hydroxybenzoate polyprenyltransferase